MSDSLKNNKMTDILVISATNGGNLDLAHRLILKIGQMESSVRCEIISLEDYPMPLYTESSESEFKNSDILKKNVSHIQMQMMNCKGIIWCVPEYNGGIPPIVVNAIAWISRASNDWKQSFMEKYAIVSSVSGGNGRELIYALRMQLAYIGMIVFPQYLIQTKYLTISEEKISNTLNPFLRLLKSV